MMAIWPGVNLAEVVGGVCVRVLLLTTEVAGAP